jgi:hypothetical protein
VVAAIIFAVIVVVIIPVGVCMSGAVGAGILGFALKSDADARHEGSELLESNY